MAEKKLTRKESLRIILLMLWVTAPSDYELIKRDLLYYLPIF